MGLTENEMCFMLTYEAQSLPWPGKYKSLPNVASGVTEYTNPCLTSRDDLFLKQIVLSLETTFLYNLIENFTSTLGKRGKGSKERERWFFIALRCLPIQITKSLITHVTDQMTWQAYCALRLVLRFFRI
ncbi:hypothetical protein NPIL_413371 [Nephila pilipes]|uniref:Uncharacterized protein n=1 Tax=Nephila pilipes TaxID=299642 RepID=A0A8X6UIY6_NEPPI|nr:hypothetical protein NPIL_413371 [Nephila pilipes]